MNDQSNSPLDGNSLGLNPRQSAEYVAEYRQLRDARSQARAAERRAEASDAENRDVGVDSNWRAVRDVALSILQTVGQDIEVVVWLIEAETRLDGHAGLARAAGRLAQMVTLFGRDLHPQPEDDDDRPFDLISGLNGMGREGTLVQPLRLLPLVPDAPFGLLTLWHATAGGEESEVARAMTDVGPDAMQRLLSDVELSKANLAECDTALTALLGGDAPSFALLTDILDDTVRTIRNLANLAVVEDVEEEDVPDSDAASTDPATATAVPRGAIQSREEAFAQMLRIASYFRKAEPHSPIADALETLVRRGRMDFMSLIEELIVDPHMRQTVMTTAGIGQKTNNDGGTDT